MTDDMFEALSVQTNQEVQMRTELEGLLDRFAMEYAVTKYQVAGLLEQAKLEVLGLVAHDHEWDGDDEGEEWKQAV